MQKGDVLSETQFYIIDRVEGQTAYCKNEKGQDIALPKKYVDDCTHSASDYSKTTKLTKTQMAELFVKSSSVAMTVNFNKQVKEAEVATRLAKKYEDHTVTSATFKKEIKEALKGEERTMIGHHSSDTDDFGRIQFTDMEVTSGHNQRLVDPRTINWMILKGVRYELKK